MRSQNHAFCSRGTSGQSLHREHARAADVAPCPDVPSISAHRASRGATERSPSDCVDSCERHARRVVMAELHLDLADRCAQRCVRGVASRAAARASSASSKRCCESRLDAAAPARLADCAAPRFFSERRAASSASSTSRGSPVSRARAGTERRAARDRSHPWDRARARSAKYSMSSRALHVSLCSGRRAATRSLPAASARPARRDAPQRRRSVVTHRGNTSRELWHRRHGSTSARARYGNVVVKRPVDATLSVQSGSVNVLQTVRRIEQIAEDRGEPDVDDVIAELATAVARSRERPAEPTSGALRLVVLHDQHVGQQHRRERVLKRRRVRTECSENAFTVARRTSRRRRTVRRSRGTRGPSSRERLHSRADCRAAAPDCTCASVDGWTGRDVVVAAGAERRASRCERGADDPASAPRR